MAYELQETPGLQEVRYLATSQGQRVHNILHFLYFQGGGTPSTSGNFLLALEALWSTSFSPVISDATILNETKILEVLSVAASPSDPSQPVVTYGQEDQLTTEPNPKGVVAAPYLPTYVAATIKKTAQDATQKAFGSIRIGALSESSTEAVDKPNELTGGAFLDLVSLAQALSQPIEDPAVAMNELRPAVFKRVAAIGQPTPQFFAPPVTATQAFQLVGSQVSRKKLREQF